MAALRRVNRSAMVPYTPAQMYALVEDVERYPEFLPWCTGSALHEKNDSELRASIDLGLGELKARFSTRNELQPPGRMTMELEDGLFRTLHGCWEFAQLGEAGCEVRLQVEFEFEGTVHNILFGAAFEKVCNELIDAFVKRAAALYGSDA